MSPENEQHRPAGGGETQSGWEARSEDTALGVGGHGQTVDADLAAGVTQPQDHGASWPDGAVAAVTASWLDIAGERLAYLVARGALCDRCARRSLLTIGLAGGVPAGTLVRKGLAGYQRAFAAVADEVAAALGLDDGGAA